MHRLVKAKQKLKYIGSEEHQMSKSKNQMNETEKELKCKQVQRATYIYARPGIEVFDHRGKRRIGKDNYVQIMLHDKIVYDGVEYVVSIITDLSVTLKKV